MSDKTSTPAPAIPSDVAEMPPGALRLPSGGWALLRDERSYSGADRKMMRRALNEDGMGDMISHAYSAGLAVRIESWSIPGKPNLAIPRWDVKMLDLLTGDDLEALEDAIGAWARRVVGLESKADKATTEGDGPGTPQQPADA